MAGTRWLRPCEGTDPRFGPCTLPDEITAGSGAKSAAAADTSAEGLTGQRRSNLQRYRFWDSVVLSVGVPPYAAPPFREEVVRL
jgi:hypothetical protein